MMSDPGFCPNKQRRRRDQVSTGTIRNDLWCLSSIFTRAEEWEWVKGNPISAYIRARAKRGMLAPSPTGGRSQIFRREVTKLNEKCLKLTDARRDEIIAIMDKEAWADVLPDLRWHDLRRTCGCRLLQDYKMSMEAVSKWLGHSSIQVTEKSYAFLETRHLHEAVGTYLEDGGEEHALRIESTQNRERNRTKVDTTQSLDQGSRPDL